MFARAFKRMHELIFVGFIAGTDQSMARFWHNLAAIPFKKRQDLMKEVGFDLSKVDQVREKNPQSRYIHSSRH